MNSSPAIGPVPQKASSEDPFDRQKFRKSMLLIPGHQLIEGETGLALTVAPQIASKFHFRPQSFLQRRLSLHETTVQAPAVGYRQGSGYECVCLLFDRSCPGVLSAAPTIPDEAAGRIK